MIYPIYTLIFKLFDSVVLTIFLLRFNKYEISEKPAFFSLIPVLTIIAVFFKNWPNIFAVLAGILISFIFMIVLNFNRTGKAKCLWSVVFIYKTLMIVNFTVYNAFQSFKDAELLLLGKQTDAFFLICIVSKSIFLLIIKTYLCLEKRLNKKNADISIFNLFYTSFSNIMLIAIFTRITSVELSFVYALITVDLLISQIIQYDIYTKISQKATVALDYKLLKQKNNFNKNSYKKRRKEFDDIARINHDIKNHLMFVAYNIKHQKYEKAENYIQGVLKKLDVLPGIILLKNDNLNFIINTKIGEAKRKGISVTAQIEDINDCIMGDYDLCSLLGNILDNAIESAEKEIQKHIIIEIYTISAYQVYYIKNRVEKSVLDYNAALSSTKKNSERHGYGMKQIYSIISLYHGHIDIYEQEKYFNIRVLIPREI